ncbi:YybH family protein [Namhaeicola litoreus]|uniref:YybH family protein n=1 Tax=Namhaeicola litoreus TaxID=1052145 RepID=A0ABW3Y4U7_9FLAO
MTKNLIFYCFMILSTPFYGQNFIGEKEEIDQILKNISKFSAHVVNSDHISIGKAYTSDAKIFPNNKDIILGTNDITNYWKKIDGSRTIAHKITPLEIKVIGNEAYDYGYYEGTTKTSDGKETSWKGKYVIVWKKVEKDWKIYLDIWNRIAE